MFCVSLVLEKDVLGKDDNTIAETKRRDHCRMSWPRENDNRVPRIVQGKIPAYKK